MAHGAMRNRNPEARGRNRERLENYANQFRTEVKEYVILNQEGKLGSKADGITVIPDVALTDALRRLESGQLGPVNGYDPRVRDLHAPIFPTTNEVFTPEFLRDINEVVKSNGITKYVGVCGGGNQHLVLLNNLDPRPKDVILVDFDLSQLLNFMVIVGKSLKAESIGDLQSMLRDHGRGWYGSAFAKGVVQPFTTNLGIEVRLQVDEIVAHIKRIGEDGKYFIFLSNVMQGTSNGYTGSKPMDAALENPHILEGSVIVSMNYGSNPWYAVK